MEKTLPEFRRSDRGRPNFRLQAETRGLSWNVDIYSGRYFRARVGTETGEIIRTIPALVGHLNLHLGLG